MADPQDALDELLASGGDELAARLFVASYPPDDRPKAIHFGSVRERVIAEAGVADQVRFSSLDQLSEPGYSATLDIVLVWEKAALAARLADSGRGQILVLLRRGRSVLARSDPYAAALAAIRAA